MGVSKTFDVSSILTAPAKISLTNEGRLLKDKAVNVPKSLAKEINLSEEEIVFFYKILYKILNETKED